MRAGTCPCPSSIRIFSFDISVGSVVTSSVRGTDQIVFRHVPTLLRAARRLGRTDPSEAVGVPKAAVDVVCRRFGKKRPRVISLESED